MPRPFRAIRCIGLVLLLAACGDPYEFRPTRETIARSFSAYALTGTPIAYPTALATIALIPVRIDPSARFDVAFDIDGSGNVVIRTVRDVLGQELSFRRVGLQEMDIPFDSLFRAPNSGYRYDSLLTVAPGAVVAIQSQRPSDCAFEISELVYSKIVVDSVRPSERIIFFSGVVDPSCGFRSFLPGIPES